MFKKAFYSGYIKLMKREHFISITFPSFQPKIQVSFKIKLIFLFQISSHRHVA